MISSGKGCEIGAYGVGDQSTLFNAILAGTAQLTASALNLAAMRFVTAELIFTPQNVNNAMSILAYWVSPAGDAYAALVRSGATLVDDLLTWSPASAVAVKRSFRFENPGGMDSLYFAVTETGDAVNPASLVLATQPVRF